MKSLSRKLAMIMLALAGLSLAACSTTPEYRSAISHKGTTGTPTYKVGNPYKVDGRWYYPKEDKYYNKVGTASWYGPQFHNQRTANGEVFDMNALTAAHTTLPMPSFVRVTNLENGRSVILRINDRGPFVNNRIIDVSRRAAQLLGFEQKGTARVRVEAITAVQDAPVQMAADAPAPSAETNSAHNPDNGPIMPAAPASPVETAALPLATDTPGNDTATVATAEGAEVFVQAGAFLAYDNAERLANSLKKLGTITLSTISVGEHKLFRVRIGPFKSMGEADAMLGKIVARGLNSARIVVD